MVRLFVISAMVGSAVLAANPMKQEQTPVTKTKGQQVIVPGDVDPVVTGQTLSNDDIAQWQEQRKRYLECPECETKQPFPGD